MTTTIAKLTPRQRQVLDALTQACRKSVIRYRDNHPRMFEGDLKKLAAGDKASVFGLGALTYGVGHTLGIKASAVLSAFKALEKKGLVIRESGRRAGSPLYWWPVGLAATLHAELAGSMPEKEAP